MTGRDSEQDDPGVNDEMAKRVARAVVREVLSQTTRLSRDDASDLAAAAANKAVNEAHIRLFSHLGYDLANRDDIKRLKKNLDFVDRLCARCDTVGTAVTTAVSTAFAVFILGLLGIGLYFWAQKAPPMNPPHTFVK